MSTTSQSQIKKSYKIILLGDTGVGKTSIIERYIHNKFDSHEQPTIGIDFLGKTILYKGSKCRLQLWDSAGQQRYMSLIPAYLRDADCALFVFDVNKPSTLLGIQKWIQLYRDNHQRRSVSLLCGNKQDLPKNFDKQSLQKLMQKHHLPLHCLSAKTGQNLQELFGVILDLVTAQKVVQRQNREETQSQPTTEGGMVDAKSKVRVKVEQRKEKECFC